MGPVKSSRSTVQELLGDVCTAAKANPIALSFLEDNLIPAGDSVISPRQFIEDIDSIKKTSIKKKISSNAYDQDIHLFYQDLKLACIHELNQLAIGSDQYKETFSVFQYLAELILREGFRLGFLEVEEKGSDDDDETETRNHVKDFETAISAKFRQVQADVLSAYGEAFFVVTQNRGPLFSSLNGKASIDPRETKTHGSFNTTKVQPLTQSFIAPYQLGFVSPSISSIPHPALPPTELLRNFVPPVESPMPATNWLRFDEYSSFAPTKDSTNSLISDSLVGSVWYEKKFVANYLDPAFHKGSGSNATSVEDVSMTDESTDQKGGAIKQTNGNSPADEYEEDEEDEDDDEDDEDGFNEDDAPETDNGDIDLLKIFEWAPGNEIKDEELVAFENGTAEQYLSKLILETQFLQRARLADNSGSEFIVGDRERLTALRARNLLARLASGYAPKDLGIVPITDIPVLQVNYQGTLPGTDRPTPAQARLSGLKSSGKSSKSNRR